MKPLSNGIGEIDAMCCECLIGDPRQFDKIVGQHRIDPRPYEHIHLVNDVQRLHMQFHRADLHQFGELARPQPAMRDRALPRGEFEVEDDGVVTNLWKTCHGETESGTGWH